MKPFALAILLASMPAFAAGGKPVPVTLGNFVRAESDLYFSRNVKRGGLRGLSCTPGR